MKRLSGLGILLGFLVSLCFGAGVAYGEDHTPQELLKITREAGYDVLDQHVPKAAIVIDAQEGQVLWGQEPDLVWNPASMTKMMTVYLVLDAIAAGKLSFETEIVATPQDQAVSELYLISNSKLVAGVGYPVRELLKMVVVPSSNAATLMLANALSDHDGAAFVAQMNAKAQSLGMTKTIFYNCSGAEVASFAGLYEVAGSDPHASNQTTARDLAVMAFHLLKEHEEVLAFTKEPKVTVMAGTPYEETFETYNYSLPGAKYGCPGVDGLKTGSSPSAAFNYLSTAKRGDTRLIEVILGVGDWSDQGGEYYRHPFGNALYEKIFKEYAYQKVLDKGEHQIQGRKIQLQEDFYTMVKKDQQPDLQLKGERLTLADTAPPVKASLISGTEAFKVAPVEPVAPPAPKQHGRWWQVALVGLLGIVAGLCLHLFRGQRRDQRGKRPYGHAIKGCLIGGLGLFVMGIVMGIVTFIGSFF